MSNILAPTNPGSIKVESERIVQAISRGETPVIPPIILERTLLYRYLAETGRPEVIQHFLTAYGAQLQLRNVTQLIGGIIQYAPQMVSLTYSMVKFYDADEILRLVQKGIDFSPMISQMNKSQLDAVFNAAVRRSNHDIIQYLYSNGYRPDQETLNLTLGDICEEIANDGFNPQYTDSVKWLLEQGARPSIGWLANLTTGHDIESTKLLLAAMPPEMARQELQDAVNQMIDNQEDPYIVNEFRNL